MLLHDGASWQSGRLAEMDHPAITSAVSAGRSFRALVNRFNPAAKPLILGHIDADGLSAVAILARSLERYGQPADIRLVGKGENPWSPAMHDELARRAPGGLIITDLGVREGELAPGVPTAIIDHHVPTGVPGEATSISGHGLNPEPTSSPLAFWYAEALGHADFTNSSEFSTFVRTAEGLEFDVMMEGKAKDISILKLRPDLLRFAPDVGARFGICLSEAEELDRQWKELETGVSTEDEPDVDEGTMVPLPAEAAE